MKVHVYLVTLWTVQV